MEHMDMELRDRLLMEIIEAMQSRLASKEYPGETPAAEMGEAAPSDEAPAEEPKEMGTDNLPPMATPKGDDEDDEALMAELEKMHLPQ